MKPTSADEALLVGRLAGMLSLPHEAFARPEVELVVDKDGDYQNHFFLHLPSGTYRITVEAEDAAVTRRSFFALADRLRDEAGGTSSERTQKL